jgi:hypothetical protein
MMNPLGDLVVGEAVLLPALDRLVEGVGGAQVASARA